MGFDVCTDVSGGDQTAVLREDRTDNWKVVKQIRLRLEKGQEAVLIKKAAVVTSRDPEAAYKSEITRVSTLLEEIKAFSYDDLKDEHRRAWESKWNSSDVVIKGNDRLQKAIRFSVYHLIRSNMEFDSRVQICAKGYAGEAYYGRYFWDSEIYMLPFFIYTNPQAAKNMLLYRYHTLDGAR